MIDDDEFNEDEYDEEEDSSEGSGEIPNCP